LEGARELSQDFGLLASKEPASLSAASSTFIERIPAINLAKSKLGSSIDSTDGGLALSVVDTTGSFCSNYTEYLAIAKNIA
jgi:hypothetical protein